MTPRTRPVPAPAADAREITCGPRGLKDVGPGDLVLLEDGDYGAAQFTKDGEPGRPIVYRSTSGKAIFQEVGLSDRKWVYLEAVTGFRDCLSHLEDDSAAMQMCNDWLNNEVSVGLDDGIEADFALSNCRIMRNRLTDCFVGISSQPGLGGPNYFIRNVMYNMTYSAFKLHRFSQGDVILHNTVLKAGDGFGNHTNEGFDVCLVLNNIFVGGKLIDANFGGFSPGRGRAVDVQRFGQHCIFDYNAYGTHGIPFEGKYRTWTFTKLPGIEFEPHGIQLDIAPVENFVKARFPDDPDKLHEAPDLRLKASSSAVDAARVIANVNDAFHGTAPDAGAYEIGNDLPVYGPRQ